MNLKKPQKPLKVFLVAAVLALSAALFLALGPPQLLAKSESPAFCAGCHVMEEEHTAWSHAGAHRRLRCVDCHLPEGNPVVHYVWKGIDGMKDVICFHTGHVPERIELSAHGAEVVQANCVRCHQSTLAGIDTTRRCWGCHRQLRHRLTGTMATR
ncbi:cytochrome c nitrite reductase small subunit [Geomesophilobacter sediminis]|uniref:Cytochrome c nitrite reductase small subunit n=1 Tax=Geomesophilobacter sediminis TaxID=2798584 RepID=A0A8J7J7C4_9BACT|nr:cytochrome c nitrite reductase small subunit [Geomesophilobacter sediminis]MBJ6725051.1 cytochrome c nitrite reductase small subunit [Geomesophilobacter sediminis]